MFPWELIDLTIKRDPQGIMRFSVYLAGNSDMGLPYIFGHGQTPDAAAEDAIRQAGPDRNPEACRKKKLAELRLQIAKLEALDFSLPPWRPPRPIGDVDPVTESAIRPNPDEAIDV